jgi:AcrR family transcriptional regulator
MQARADRTRRIILKAAAESFEARGYLGTRLQDVVAGQDVSKGALYFHFPSKEDLAAAVIQEQHHLWPDLIVELRDHHPRAIRLLMELSWQVAGMFRDNVLVRASARLVSERDQIGVSIPPLFSGWAETIDKLLAEARAQGDLLPDVDTRGVSELIVAAFAGCQRISEAANRGTDLRQRVTSMWHYLLPGLITAECLVDMNAIDSIAGRN